MNSMAIFPGILALAMAGTGLLPAAADNAVDQSPPCSENVVEARLAKLPDAELKGLYRQCARSAVRGTLSMGETAMCSLVYEYLLQRTFGGDFMALLAWRRSKEE